MDLPEQLEEFIRQATYLTVNDYEWSMIHDKTGLNTADVASQVQALVITKGGEGSTIYAGGETIEITSVKVDQVVDPTGCGDAYRAGMLYGLSHDMDWPTIGRIASLMGAIKIQHGGTQNHTFTDDEFDALYEQHFGTTLERPAQAETPASD